MRNLETVDKSPKLVGKKLTRTSNLMYKLSKRADYVSVAKRGSVRSNGFDLQGVQRSKELGFSSDIIRVGFTCSKKVGKAVLRNKAKRRLKHLARLVLPKSGKPGWDYVIVGRRVETTKANFRELQLNLANSLDKLHSKNIGLKGQKWVH
jgi:ribonuclease P protein component